MIEKITYREQVKDVLVQLMFDGEILPGSRVSLPEIANRLEISVTPIREALTQLTEVGVVTYIPNRGFFLTELTQAEAVEIYELIAALESAALQSIEYDAKNLDALEAAQRKFLKKRLPLDRVKADMNFHKTLIAGNNNSLMRKIIEDVRIRIFFYELDFMAENLHSQDYESSHEAIIEYLRNGKKKKAIKALDNNWRQSVDSILLAFQKKN